MERSPPGGDGPCTTQGYSLDVQRTNSSGRSRLSGHDHTVDEKRGGEPAQICITSSSPPCCSAAPSEEDEIEYPEGGWQAWGVVLGSFCALMSTFGLANSQGAIQAWLIKYTLHDHSETEISWIFSVWIFLMFLGSVQVGPLFDNFGIRPLVLPGSILYVISIFVLSWCHKYYQFMLGFSVLGGLSASLIYNPCVTVLGHWFLKRRSLVMGIAFSGGSVGGVLFPLILNRLFHHVGYGWGIRIMGFIILFLMMVTNLLVKSRELKRRTKLADAVVDFTAFKDPRYLFTVIGIFCIEWAFFVPVNYIITYALQEVHMSATAANQLVAYLNAASSVGRWVPGYVADYLGAFNMAILVCFLSGLVALVVWLPTSNAAGTIAYAVLFGFFSGASLPLGTVCIGKISDTRKYGTRYGTCNFVCSFGSLTGMPISTALLGRHYVGLIIFSGVVFIVGSMSFGVARVLGGRRELLY